MVKFVLMLSGVLCLFCNVALASQDWDVVSHKTLFKGEGFVPHSLESVSKGGTITAFWRESEALKDEATGEWNHEKRLHILKTDGAQFRSNLIDLRGDEHFLVCSNDQTIELLHYEESNNSINICQLQDDLTEKSVFSCSIPYGFLEKKKLKIHKIINCVLDKNKLVMLVEVEKTEKGPVNMLMNLWSAGHAVLDKAFGVMTFDIEGQGWSLDQLPFYEVNKSGVYYSANNDNQIVAFARMSKSYMASELTIDYFNYDIQAQKLNRIRNVCPLGDSIFYSSKYMSDIDMLVDDSDIYATVAYNIREAPPEKSGVYVLRANNLEVTSEKISEAGRESRLVKSGDERIVTFLDGNTFFCRKVDDDKSDFTEFYKYVPRREKQPKGFYSKSHIVDYCIESLEVGRLNLLIIVSVSDRYEVEHVIIDKK